MTTILWDDNRIAARLDTKVEKRIEYADAFVAMSEIADDYEAALSKAATDYASLYSLLSAKADTNNALSAQVADLQNTNANLSTTLAVAQSNNTALNAQVTDLTAQVTTLNAQTLSQGITIANLAATRDALTDTASSLREQVDDLTGKLAADDSAIAALRVQVTDLSPDVTVTVGSAGVTSRTVPAVSYVEQTPLWNSAAWPNIKANVAPCVGAHKIHIYPFGLLDPWGDSTKPIDLSTGNRLATGLAKLREVSASDPIILTLYGAPWWMKHTVFNNAITDMTASQAYSDSGRVKPSQLAKWLQLVDKCVEAAANAGCRDFETWNELKGWYDVYPHVGQKWDASMGTSPVVGFSYFAQQTIAQVVATMTRLGIPQGQYRISTPYMMLRSAGTKNVNSVPSTHPLYQYGTSWGYADKMGLNALNDYLANAKANGIPLDVLGLDLATGNSDGVYATADPFDLVAKWGHYLSYVRGLLPTYGYDADLPIDFNELYPFPQPALRDANSEALRAALWADTLRQCVLGRVRYPILWGATAPANASYDNLGGLVAADGTLQKTGKVFQLYRDNFAPGVKVYPLVASDSRVDGLGSDAVTVLHNKTNTPLSVALNGDVFALAPYDVRKIVHQ